MKRWPRNTLAAVLMSLAVCMSAFGVRPACAQPAASEAMQPLRLAVVELRNTAGLRDEEVAYLTDLARTQARQELPTERFLVMTRESIVALLPPGKTLADCAKGQCEVEVGRTIGADYIVTGEVLKFGDELRLNLKVHACVSGDFLGSAPARGTKVNDLESGLVSACGKLFSLVKTHAGVGGVSGGTNGISLTEGTLGSAPPVWNPTAKKKRVVRITSDPPGAVVQMDGEVLCQSTPCSRELVPGVVQLQMQKERYTSRREVVTIPAEGSVPAVEWKLAPTFGWLTVRTTPEDLAVTVDGEPAGSSPVVRRELDPGAHEVRVADARYYESGQRVVVVMGAEREVALAAVPREGAIEVSAVNDQGDAVTGTVLADGRTLGEVPGTYKLMVGKHRVEVRSEAGQWNGDVVVAERQVAPVVAKLAKDADLGDAGYELLADGEIVKRGDLMWTVRDNGSDVNWSEAKAYCKACRVGGYSDWRMPTIEELKGLYDSKRSVKATQSGSDVHIASPFALSKRWQWSSTLDGSSSAFSFPFGSGKRYSNNLTDRLNTRVLCVRRSGE